MKNTAGPRPIGVSVIAVLVALGGICLFIGAAVFAALSTAGGFLQELIEMYAGTIVPNIGELITAIALAIAAILAILGIISLVDAYGLWTGKGWAWYLTVILLILGIISGLLSLPAGIISIIISGLLIWYFFRPYVKAFFGLGPAPTPPPAPPA